MWEKHLKSLNNRESYISITVGFFTVLIVGILIYNHLPHNKITSKQETKNKPIKEKATTNPETYIVVQGERLWDIAVKFYGDGYTWTKIAQTNNLSNPNTIHPGNTLIIPR